MAALCVSNLPPDIGREEVLRLFCDWGEVKDIAFGVANDKCYSYG
jgi:hypothetical protein